MNRLPRAADEPAILDLWAAVFGEDRDELRRACRAADPAWLERTRIAVAADGRLLGAASYSVRRLRDAAGRPRRVGHLGYLAVRAEARGQGHGRRLLEATLDALRRARCVWAMALPGPGAAGFYARHGWRAVPLLVCEGTPITAGPAAASAYAVRPYDPTTEPGGWAALADVYAADSARRPLSLVREPSYWAASIAPRVLGQQDWLGPPATLLVAAHPTAPEHLAGYVLVHWWHLHDGPPGDVPGYFQVSELCTRPGQQEAATTALLQAVGQVAATQDCRMGLGRLFVPREPRIEHAIGDLLRDPEWSTFVALQAAPLMPALDDAQLTALLAAPGAVCWSLDVL
jgi:GNAT superfamily N-acetyltransferase